MPKQPWKRNTRHYKREAVQGIVKGVKRRQRTEQRKNSGNPSIVATDVPLHLRSSPAYQMRELFLSRVREDLEVLGRRITQSNRPLTLGLPTEIKIGVKWRNKRISIRKSKFPPHNQPKIVAYKTRPYCQAILIFYVDHIRCDRRIYPITRITDGIVYLSCDPTGSFRTTPGPECPEYGIDDLKKWQDLPCIDTYRPDEKTHVPVNSVKIVTI